MTNIADGQLQRSPYPVLYSFRRCPYAMRARLALAGAGLVSELREIVLANKPEALRQASPKATVPVWVLPDGTVIDQSLDIMLHALRLNDPRRLLQGSNGDVDTMLDWVAICDGSFKQALDRYKYPSRFGLTDGLAYRAQGSEFLQQLNLRLNAYSYLMGVHATLADYAIAPFVRQFAHVDKAWFETQDWPELQHWLNAFEASAEFAKVMQKHPPWTERQPVVLFPCVRC